MAGRTRRHWPDEVKRRVVVETYAEGASVAEVALRHGINANLVFIWRKDPRFNPRHAGARLLPVEITGPDSKSGKPPVLNALPDAPVFDTCSEPPSIEIALPSGVRLICRGGIDTAALADVLWALKTA